MTQPQTPRLLTALTLAVSALVLGACTSVHPRVWQNGAAMEESGAFRALMSGDRSVAAQRRLYSSATPLRRWQREQPYAPFGRW